MFESLGFETLTPRGAAIILGLLLGLGFGALAEVTRFCFRRGLVGEAGERKPALGVWLTALAVAVLATQGAVAMEWISFDDHRFMVSDLPVAAIVIGGLAFGAGMVLTRGCVSRLTVLTGSGNLRALTVLVIFAITAHATLKGVLAPVRTWLGGFTLPLESASLASYGGAWIWAVVIAVAALAYAARSGARRRDLLLATGIGAIAALGWIGTGYVLYDEFDPIAMESLSFTSPAADTLFWTVASTSIPAGFGAGLVGGVILGAAVLALLSGRFQWQSFDTPRQTGRYFSGAVLMGIGGVLAGGCTVGAGLSGVPSLSIAAILALVSIAGGALVTDRALRAASGSAAPASTRQPIPAE